MKKAIRREKNNEKKIKLRAATPP